MSNPDRERISEDNLKNSSLYTEYQAELEEINRHKWIESEKAGRDVGFEFALTDWILKHRVHWRTQRRSQRSSVCLG